MNARVLGGRLRVSANMIAMSVLGGASSGKTRTNSPDWNLRSAM